MQDILSQVHISDLVEQTDIQDNDVFPIDSTTDTLKVKASTLKQYIGGELASGKIDKTEKGAVNGVATLDGNGLVPSSQLPSFVDDVLEGTAQNPTQTAAGTYSATGFILIGESTPCTLEEGKTYVDTSSNIQYRWTGTGSNLVSMGSGLVLGETQYSAYAGNKGKANADAISALQSGKVDKVDGKGLSTEDFTTEEKQKLATLVVGENYAELSEAYAIGTRNGVPVTSGDVAYHNNSKYHAEQSQASAILSGSYMNIAGVSAQNAELSAIRSGSNANIAGLSAETANDNALKSEGFAVGKQNGTDVGSTSPYYHNNAEYFKNLAEEAAAQAGALDMTGATATTDGTHGLIKQPHAGDQDKVFQGNGTWGHKLQIDIVEQNGVYGYIDSGGNFVAFKSQADIDAAVAAAMVGTATAADVKEGVTFTNSSQSGLTGTFAAQEKTVTAGTSAASVTPDSGKYLSKVTYNPTPSQEKSTTASRSAQTITPDSGKLLSKVSIAKYPDASGTYTPTANSSASDMGATNNYRYVDTRTVYNLGKANASISIDILRNDCGGFQDWSTSYTTTKKYNLIVVCVTGVNDTSNTWAKVSVTGATYNASRNNTGSDDSGSGWRVRGNMGYIINAPKGTKISLQARWALTCFIYGVVLS